MRTRPLLALLLAPALAAQTHLYTTEDLGVVPQASPIGGVTAEAMSRDASKVTGGSWDPYVWERGNGMRRLELPSISPNVGFAADVNSQGIAVGYSGLTSLSLRAAFWDAGSNYNEIHDATWLWSQCLAVNDSGQMLVRAALPDGTSLGNAHAFLREPDGTLLDLTPGSQSGAALALNERGQALLADSAGYWVRDPDGTRTPVPTTYTPQRISERGEVLGLDNNDVALWSPATGWRTIPDPQLSFRRLGAVNDFGQVVASHAVRTGISPPRYAYYGYLFTPGLGWSEFNANVDQSQSIFVDELVGISETGEVVGFGSIGPDNRAMILTPRFTDTYGAGCGGNQAEAPRALAAGDPNPGGRIALLGVGDPETVTAAAFLVAPQAGNVPLAGGCTLWLDPANLLAVAVAPNVLGQASLALDVPGQGTSGFSLFAQYATLDGVGLALSNGARIDFP